MTNLLHFTSYLGSKALHDRAYKLGICATILAQRAMYLAGTRLAENAAGILYIDSSTGHDD